MFLTLITAATLTIPTSSIHTHSIDRCNHCSHVRMWGTVEQVGESWFEMTTSMNRSYTVHTSQETEWEGLQGIWELNPGDQVVVEGDKEGNDIWAESVELMGGGNDGGEDNHGGDDDGGNGDHDHTGGGGAQGCDHRCFESQGMVTQVIPPSSFMLDNGKVFQTDTSTTWDPQIGSLSGLSYGIFVSVDACYRGHSTLLARQVNYLGSSASGGYQSFEGQITSVDHESSTFEVGSIQIVAGASTEFEGDAEAVTDLAPGWYVKVTAIATGQQPYHAVLVVADDMLPTNLEGMEWEAGEALVVLAEGANPEEVAGRWGAELEASIGSAYLFKWHEELTEELLASLEADPDVVACEPNWRFRDPESVRKRYPIVDRSPTLDEFLSQPSVGLIGLTARPAEVNGEGIVVAVLDTGVDPFHPVLRRRILSGGLDVVDGDRYPWEESLGIDEDEDGEIDEAYGHGTLVASLIALVAPAAKILPYRVLDDDGGGTAFGVAMALADAISRRVDVINLSLEYRKRSAVVDQLLSDAYRAGIVVVAAAGNDHTDQLPFPASDSHTIAVASVSTSGTLSPFSNWGTSVDLAAPGEEAYGALPQFQMGSCDGTSMAAPLVSGAVALLLQLDPKADPQMVRAALMGASQLGNSLPIASGIISIPGLIQAATGEGN